MCLQYAGYPVIHAYLHIIALTWESNLLLAASQAGATSVAWCSPKFWREVHENCCCVGSELSAWVFISELGWAWDEAAVCRKV